MNLLSRIKRLVLHGFVEYTYKALAGIERDNLTTDDVEESIMNAPSVRSKRSRSPGVRGPGEKVHIMQGLTFDKIPVYTKGVIRRKESAEIFYVLISAKRSQRPEL